MSKVIWVSCGIFQEEMEYILAQEGLTVDIRWQEPGLHHDIDLLQGTLEQAVEGIRGTETEAQVSLLYGFRCLPDMKEVAQRLECPVLGTHNCLSALVGNEELKKLEENRTMVASPGWVRKMWLGRVGTTLGWTVDDYRMQFGRYDRILILDPGIAPLSDEEIITCFDLVQVPLEIQPCGLEHFRELLLGMLNQSGPGTLHPK